MEVNDQYRINHSKIIEQFQLVEYHLEGLFAIMLDNGSNFEELTKRVEHDAMGELIRKVRFLVKEYDYKDILTNSIFTDLSKVRDDRNYYCHENYLEDKNENYNSKRKTTIEEDFKFVSNLNIKLRDAFTKIRKYK